MLLHCGTSYLFPAERNGVFKQTPDDSFLTGWCGEGAIIAKILVHILLRRDQHLQGHTGQLCAVC